MSSFRARKVRRTLEPVFTILAIIIGANSGQPQELEPTRGQIVSPPSSKSFVERRCADFPATLRPGKTALLKARQDEQVERVQVEIGSRVKKGQTVLQFVDARERVRVERAEALRDRAQAEYRRVKRLHTEELVSDEALEKAAIDLRIAEADLELAKIELEELSVRAPFDGVVAERHIDPGAFAEMGDPLVRVNSATPLRLEAMLPEEALGRLRRAGVVTVSVRSPPAKFAVPLEEMPAALDPSTKTFLLQISVQNPGERFVPGTSCRISVGDDCAKAP